MMRNAREFYMFPYPIKPQPSYLCRKRTAMKTRTLHLPAAALLCIGTISCNGLMDMQDKGSISIRISESKSLSLPDTEDYILSVRSADGRTVYEGRFGDSPEELEVK